MYEIRDAVKQFMKLQIIQIEIENTIYIDLILYQILDDQIYDWTFSDLPTANEAEYFFIFEVVENGF